MLDGQAQLPHAAHGEEGHDDGALVVVSAAAVEAAVALEDGLVGRGVPAIALDNDVEVAENVEAGGLVVEVGGADGAAVYLRGKAVFRAEGQGLVQGGPGAGAEGRVRLCLAAHASDGDKAADVAYELGLVGVDPLGYAFLNCHHISSLVYFSASAMMCSTLSPTWNSPFS